MPLRPYRAILRVPALYICVTLHAHAQPTKDQCVDANEAAQAYKQSNQLTRARIELQACLNEACPGPVRQDCIEIAKAVDAVMPTLIFDARDARGTAVTEVRVTVDERPFVERLDGTPLPVDPGWHQFEFSAPGLPRTSKNVLVKTGEKNRRLRVDLVDKTGPILRIVGIGGMAAGGLSIALGAYLGVRSKATYDDALEHCPNGARSCDATGVRDGERAHDQAASSTAAFVIGGLLAAGGVTLYVLGSKMTLNATPTVRADAGGLLLRGAF